MPAMIHIHVGNPEMYAPGIPPDERIPRTIQPSDGVGHARLQKLPICHHTPDPQDAECAPVIGGGREKKTKSLNNHQTINTCTQAQNHTQEAHRHTQHMNTHNHGHANHEHANKVVGTHTNHGRTRVNHGRPRPKS